MHLAEKEDYYRGVRTNYFPLCFGVTLLWKLLWVINRNSKLFRPFPTLRLNLISILSLAGTKWRQYLSLFPPSASKEQNFQCKVITLVIISLLWDKI